MAFVVVQGPCVCVRFCKEYCCKPKGAFILSLTLSNLHNVYIYECVSVCIPPYYFLSYRLFLWSLLPSRISYMDELLIYGCLLFSKFHINAHLLLYIFSVNTVGCSRIHAHVYYTTKIVFCYTRYAACSLQWTMSAIYEWTAACETLTIHK